MKIQFWEERGGGGGYSGVLQRSPQIPQLQSLHHKVMLAWEPMPKLISCIIPWFYQKNSKKLCLKNWKMQTSLC